MKKYILVLLISSLLVGCSYSTKIGVGGYSASHTASISKYISYILIYYANQIYYLIKIILINNEINYITHIK